jgi:hypothetical protein
VSLLLLLLLVLVLTLLVLFCQLVHLMLCCGNQLPQVPVLALSLLVMVQPHLSGRLGHLMLLCLLQLQLLLLLALVSVPLALLALLVLPHRSGHL